MFGLTFLFLLVFVAYKTSA